jgi:hypothetical protein
MADDKAPSPWDPFKGLLWVFRDRQLRRSAASFVQKLVLAVVALAFALALGFLFAYCAEILASIPVAVVAIVAYASLLNLTRRRLEGGPHPTETLLWFTTLFFALAGGAAAIGAFAGITADLLKHGHGTVHPAITGDVYAVSAYEHYLWHLADSIPVLKVPETLHWKPAHRITDHTNGALTLAAKVLIYVPLLAIAARLLAREPADHGSSSS